MVRSSTGRPPSRLGRVDGERGQQQQCERPITGWRPALRPGLLHAPVDRTEANFRGLSSNDVRQATPQIRFLFWGIGSFFASLAAAVLLLWPADTDRLFAWTINLPVTAHFIGACFLAVSVMALLCSRVRTWGAMRAAFVGTLSFVTTMTVATLVHLDLFHLDSDEPVSLVTAWGWLAVYLAAPVTSAALLRLQLRRPGTDPAPVAGTIPAPLRTLLMGLGVVLILAAAGLFLGIAGLRDAWPWPLTPLTARAVASFLLGFGVIVGELALENNRASLVPAMVGSVTLSLLAGAALVRFDESVSGVAETGAYVVLFGSLLVGGGWGVLAAPRFAQGSSTV